MKTITSVSLVLITFMALYVSQQKPIDNLPAAPAATFQEQQPKTINQRPPPVEPVAATAMLKTNFGPMAAANSSLFEVLPFDLADLDVAQVNAFLFDGLFELLGSNEPSVWRETWACQRVGDGSGRLLPAVLTISKVDFMPSSVLPSNADGYCWDAGAYEQHALFEKLQAAVADGDEFAKLFSFEILLSARDPNWMPSAERERWFSFAKEQLTELTMHPTNEDRRAQAGVMLGVIHAQQGDIANCDTWLYSTATQFGAERLQANSYAICNRLSQAIPDGIIWLHQNGGLGALTAAASIQN